jgi:N-formylglutamate amidohydrolase
MILHIPHSATHIPFFDGFTEDRQLIDREILRLTDWYTDELFDLPGHQRIVTPFSRIFCDVERFEEDRLEPMSKFGMGVLYERTDSGQVLRTITEELRAKFLERFYRPHHRLLTSMVEKSLLEKGCSLIVDCHSFPEEPLTCSQYTGDFRPDFNIGTDSFHTPATWLPELEAYFLEKGYSVGIDIPYSGSIVPMAFFQKEKRVRSIMLEVNRKLYMDEKTGTKNNRFQKIQKVVQGFIQLLEVKEESMIKSQILTFPK